METQCISYGEEKGNPVKQVSHSGSHHTHPICFPSTLLRTSADTSLIRGDYVKVPSIRRGLRGVYI
jgi:hypothetical protein